MRLMTLFLLLYFLSACGHGSAEFTGVSSDEQNDTEALLDELNIDQENDSQEEREQQNAQIDQIAQIHTPIPDFRWSLVAYDIGGGRVRLQDSTPDPNWLSNAFFEQTLTSPILEIAALIDCNHYQFRFIATSPISISILEPLLLYPEPLCINNMPNAIPGFNLPGLGIGQVDARGLVERVFFDNENLVVEMVEIGVLEVSNGNGLILVFQAKGL